tara:strand:- start:241 stop:1305 length:1065 start_codon:yes stop_codon:yes gene_type:complete
MAAGQMPQACSACWNDEKNNIPSLRQSLNGVLTNGNPDQLSWLDLYFKNKKDYVSDLILMADVKMGNTCNHACVMCNPEDSSMIYSDWINKQDSVFVKDYTKKDPEYFNNIKFTGFKNTKYRDYIEHVINNNKHLKYLKLLGGEPLLDNQLITSLENLDDKIKKKLKLSLVTNGSVDIVNVLKRIGEFNHIQISVSLEGIGQVHEFARAGSNWNLLENNILNAVAYGVDLTIHHSFQTSTVLGFTDLVNWCKKHSIRLTCGIVNNPDYLSICSLPPRLKETAVNSIVSNKTHFTSVDNAETNTLSYDNLILKITEFEFDPALHKKFIEYIDWYQSNKNIPRLYELFPELYDIGG